MFVTNWISTTKIQKISEITNFFRHYFLSRTEVLSWIFTTVFRASVPSWGIAICLAFRKPVRVLMPRSSSTSWMLPDSLPLRGFFKSRIPPNLFNKLGRIQSGCALFLCRHISFSQHSTFNIQHSPFSNFFSNFSQKSLADMKIKP